MISQNVYALIVLNKIILLLLHEINCIVCSISKLHHNILNNIIGFYQNFQIDANDNELFMTKYEIKLLI